MLEAIRTVLFLFRCWQGYRLAGQCGFGMVTVSRHGVPHTLVMIGRGREAWRVAEFATNFFIERGRIG